MKDDELNAVAPTNAAELVDVDNVSNGFWLALLLLSLLWLWLFVDPEVPRTVAIASAVDEVDFDKWWLNAEVYDGCGLKTDCVEICKLINN